MEWDNVVIWGPWVLSLHWSRFPPLTSNFFTNRTHISDLSTWGSVIRTKLNRHPARQNHCWEVTDWSTCHFLAQTSVLAKRCWNLLLISLSSLWPNYTLDVWLYASVQTAQDCTLVTIGSIAISSSSAANHRVLTSSLPAVLDARLGWE